jgi:hypothetical protein
MRKLTILFLALPLLWLSGLAFTPTGKIIGPTAARPTSPATLVLQPAETTTSPQATESATPTPTQTDQPSATPVTPSATATLSDSPTPTPTQPVQASDTPIPAELSVSKVEPDRISQENGGTLSIYGAGFAPGIAVRLVGYGLLDAAVINPTAIRAVVPPGLKEGRYGLEVIQSSGNSVRLDNVLRIRSTTPEPTSTPTSGPYVGIASPELVIESVETDPSPAPLETAFTLRLDLVNRGDYTATNVRLALAATDLAVPSEGGSLVVIERLDPDQHQSVELKLVMSQEAPSGHVSLPITLEYSDYYYRDFASQQTIGVNVSGSGSNQPLVLLNAYQTQPASLSPGDAFTLQLELTNVGGSEARQVLVTLGGLDGGESLPFAILGSGNVRFIQHLEAGDSLELETRLILDGSAQSGVYNLPVSIAYQGQGSAAQLTEDQVVTLLVSRHPNLRIDYFQPPDPSLVGQTQELSIEVVNIGRQLVNVSTIQVGGQGLQVEQGTAFIGALDAGTSGSIDAQVTPQRSGLIPVMVTVDYLDDFNQPQTVTQTLSLQVQEAQPTPQAMGESQGQPSGGLWAGILRFLRGLFGLGS